MKHIEIIEAVNEFIRGGDESNIDKLENILHDDFRNVQYGFFEQEGVFIIDRKRYLNLITDNIFGGIHRDMEILSVDVFSNISMVKLRLESTKMVFESFISLIKENNKWKVIENMPNVKSKDERKTEGL